MKNPGICAAILFSFLALSACDTLNPPPGPQPHAKIIATSDATYMQPAGDTVERIVPAGKTADPRSEGRLTVLEKRVDLLQTQVDGLVAGQEGGTPEKTTILPAPGAMPDNGASAPLAPVARDGAADGAPTALADGGMAVHETAAPIVKAPSAKAPTVKALRVGEHPGVTRLVLDVSTRRDFHTDIDNDEHILTIEVAGTGWIDGKGEHKTPRSPLIASWQAAPDGQGGTRFAVQLRKNAKIISQQALPGGHGKLARIVIDVAGA